jgi:hypothetical protein
MLRKIFEHNREKATGWYRRFHIEELHDLYFSLWIIRMMKLRTMTETGLWHIQGRRKIMQRFGGGNLEDRTTWKI